MLSIMLESQDEEEWRGENPSPVTFPSHPLYHQWLTYNAESPLIINAFNTGTGKTKAAFLRLLKRTREKNFSLDSSEDNVLLIAPTNELLAQHARDAEKFCNDNELPYRVLSMSRATLDEIQYKPDFSEGQLRRGAALHAIMEDPRRTDHDSSKMATLFVVNPDIFYYAFYFLYNRNDRIPLFQDILALCNYIIIDEFHYYNPKQLANFLFFMRLSKELGYVDSNTKRQFCLLTATPSQKVDEYLTRLSFPIDRIDPATVVPPAEPEMTRKVRALAPVHLEIYSVDELKQDNQGEAEGLIALVDQKKPDLINWIRVGEDGAILSSSLWRIEQVYNRLRSHPALTEHLGRITGPEQREGRKEATHKSLILATPTVDIGYNFEKGEKCRQNIDFLLFDARSSDEFIQRLGRAGRVLGKEQQDIPSRVYAVVDPEFYKALQPYNGQVLSRSALRQLVLDTLPPRNDLYAYIESGAIAEAFLPIYRLRQMEETAQEARIQALFESVRQLFNEDATVKYEYLRNKIHVFLDRETCYSTFEINASEKLALVERLILKRERHPAKWLDAIEARLKDEQERRKHSNPWTKAEDVVEWLLKDIRCYFVDKARFSFREYFQPPLALISDPRCLHTSRTVSFDDVLRVVSFYKAKYFETREKWEQQVQMTAPEKAREAVVFCLLQELREPGAKLRIGLKLDVGDKLRPQWEEIFAYQLTALFGLEVTALGVNHGLTPEIQHLLSERFIPALVVAKKSRAAIEIWSLQKKAQFIPYNLQVTFADDEVVDYWAVLGTMALLIEAEIPTGILKYDWGKAVCNDDKPMMF